MLNIRGNQGFSGYRKPEPKGAKAARERKKKGKEKECVNSVQKDRQALIKSRFRSCGTSVFSNIVVHKEEKKREWEEENHCGSGTSKIRRVFLFFDRGSTALSNHSSEVADHLFRHPIPQQ
jgi:hypothetical protein